MPADREYFAIVSNGVPANGYDVYGPYLLEEAQFYFPSDAIVKLESGTLCKYYASGEEPVD